MNDISVTDTAFTGFRVVRAHFRALPLWTLLAIILALVVNAGFVATGVKVPDAEFLQQNPSQAPVFLAHLAPFILFAAIVGLIANGVIYAAMNRAVLRPADSRWGYVRMGGAELRQMGLLLLLAAIFFGVYLGLMIAAILVGILFALAGKIAGVIAGAMAVATLICALVVLAVRLSLASAETFDSGRIRLGGSWALTRGRFWPILGAYVLATALTAVVVLLAWLVELGLGAAVTGGHLQAFVSGSPQTLGALFAPISLLRTALGGFVSALIWPLFLTPAAAIYRVLAPTPAGSASW